MTDQPIKTDAQVIHDAVAVGLGVFDPVVPGEWDSKNIPCIALPPGYSVHNLEKHMERPARIRENIELLTIDSFLAYWKDFDVPDQSLIFANPEDMSFMAVLDYHNSHELPNWGTHIAQYKCPKSEEWRIWTGHNKQAMSQTTFAQFIEDNIEDIAPRDNAGPTGAAMLEVATSLEVKNKIQFKSAKRLDNGEVQLTYNEDIEGTDRTGNMKIPQEFYLAIPVFKSDNPYSVKARLRYRMASGDIKFWYDLYRIDKVLDDAFGRVVEKVTKVVGKESLFHGKGFTSDSLK